MTDADMVVAYDLSTAEDIVQGVLLSLLTRFSKKTLKCDDLAGVVARFLNIIVVSRPSLSKKHVSSVLYSERR